MKHLKHLILLNLGILSILSILLTGCNNVQPVQVKTVYIKQQCPIPKVKPIFQDYEMVILNINGIDWYAMQKSEAIKMSLNWISYKEWAEANYKLLSKFKKSKNK